MDCCPSRRRGTVAGRETPGARFPRQVLEIDVSEATCSPSSKLPQHLVSSMPCSLSQLVTLHVRPPRSKNPKHGCERGSGSAVARVRRRAPRGSSPRGDTHNTPLRRLHNHLIWGEHKRESTDRVRTVLHFPSPSPTARVGRLKMPTRRHPNASSWLPTPAAAYVSAPFAEPACRLGLAVDGFARGGLPTLLNARL